MLDDQHRLGVALRGFTPHRYLGEKELKELPTLGFSQSTTETGSQSHENGFVQ